MRILYAEDERGLSMAVAEILKMEGYEVDVAADGAEAWDFLQKSYYDAAILDIMMPKMDGIEVLKKMREQENYTPVLMLTAKATTDDRIEGLTVGADDYLGKPFVMRELIAHVTAMIRRNAAYRNALLRCGDVSLDCETGEVKSERGSLRLSGKESELLALFFKRPEYVFSPAQIDDALWGGNEGESGVRLYVSYLKNKLNQIHAGIQIGQQGDGYVLKRQ